ncbi:hypothetical protein ES703_43943 [subsurface metagenome]
MSKNIKKYVFKSKPKEITYIDGEPLKLSKDFSFFHNKIKFRKELTRLQNFFKDFAKIALQASGIRDSYLKEEYSENFLLVIFTTNQIIRKADLIIEPHKNIELNPGCFYLESNAQSMLLLAKDMEGLSFGVDTMEEIFSQTFEIYFEQKNFDDYLKIRPFKLLNCIK